MSAVGAKSDSNLASEPTIDTSLEMKPVMSEKTGTVMAGYTVITKSMIGAGMFSMAFGCADFGIVLGIMLLILAAAVTWLSLRVLSYLALDFKDTSPTFYSVSEAIMPKLKWLIDVALIINCFGGVIAYVQTFGKLLSEGLIGIFAWDTNTLSKSNTALIIQGCILLILAPLCMMKEISSTKIANMVGLGCITYILIMTFFYTPCDAAGTDLLTPGSILGAFGSFPTFIFAYACQQNMFPVSNELKDSNMKRLNTIAVASTLTGFIIYLPVMLLPYLTFGANIKSNYLYNLAPAEGSIPVPVVIAFIFASLSVSISYVLLLQPVRCSIMSLAYGNNQPTGHKEKTIRIALVTFLMLASFGMAVALGENLGLPINIAGLLGGNTMCFVMPFMLYLKKYGFDRSNKFSVAVLATLVFCILLYPICLSGIIYGAIQN